MINNNPKISLISIVNNRDIYNGFLESLNSQEGVNYEFLPIFNFENTLQSARSAFNEKAKNANGDFLVFLHPDIRFLSRYALRNIIQYSSQLNNAGVIGVAGARKQGKNGRIIISSIYQGLEKKRVGYWGQKLYEEVQTVDECFFIIPTIYFQAHPFVERNGWHFYAVEYCLQAIINNKKNYVVKAEIWHLSSGNSLDPNYILQLNDIIKEYKNYFDVICTTVKAWSTRGLFAKIYRQYYYFKQLLKKRIRK